MDIKKQTKARALNPFLAAKSDKLKDLITEVRIKFEDYEHSHQIRKRARRKADQRTFERIIEAIICNLCLVHFDKQYEAVHLPLTNKVLGKASRYKSPVLGKTLPSILNIMTAPEMALASLTKGHKTFRIIDQHLNVAPAGGVQSTLEPGPSPTSRLSRSAPQLLSMKEVYPVPKPKTSQHRLRDSTPLVTIGSGSQTMSSTGVSSERTSQTITNPRPAAHHEWSGGETKPVYFLAIKGEELSFGAGSIEVGVAGRSFRS